jgi:hypothetical protein
MSLGCSGTLIISRKFPFLPAPVGRSGPCARPTVFLAAKGRRSVEKGLGIGEMDAAVAALNHLVGDRRRRAGGPQGRLATCQCPANEKQDRADRKDKY